MESIGLPEFLRDAKSYGYLYDVPPPGCFAWIYGAFIEMYMGSRDGVTYRDMAAWQDVRRARLTQYEAELVMRMNGWAADEVARLKESED